MIVVGFAQTSLKHATNMISAAVRRADGNADIHLAIRSRSVRATVAAISLLSLVRGLRSERLANLAAGMKEHGLRTLIGHAFIRISSFAQIVPVAEIPSFGLFNILQTSS